MKEEFSKKQELLSTLSTGISSKGNTAGAYTGELNEAKENLNSSENYIKTSKLKIEHLNQQISSDQVKLVKAKQKMNPFCHPLKNTVNLFWISKRK